MIDTLKYADRLKAAGVEPRQAEAMARALQEAHSERDLVTRGDVRQELVITTADVREELAATRADLQEQLGATKADLQEQLAPMRADIALLKWMVGAALAGHAVTWSLLGRMLLH
jgi:hypothetical protein